jgi:diguanylate cyclase (GGDEF)-like protein
MLDQSKPLLRVLLRKYGVRSITLAVTLLAVTASVAITTLILIVAEGAISPVGLLISILIPSILAPLFSGRNLSLIHKLDLAEERLHLLSITDELTQAYNRRYFFERVQREFSRSLRYNTALSIAIIDFDHFKDINDEYGHLIGDAVLKHFSEICLGCIREVDVFARYGGDEFVLLFPETDLPRSMECLARILEELEQQPFQVQEKSIKIMISIGLAAILPSMNNFDDLLLAADSSLYLAKKQGGNQIAMSRT